MSHKPGDRVVAILGADQEEVRLLGFGTYVGRQPCPVKRAFMEKGLGAIEVIAREQIEYDDANGIFEDAPEEYWARMDAEEVAAGRLTQGEADRRPAERAAAAATERARPMEERVAELVDRIVSNPKIELDHGPVVWGIECWWGAEANWSSIAAGRRVVGVERS